MTRIVSLILFIFPFVICAQKPFIVDDCLQLKGLIKYNAPIYSEPDSNSYHRGVGDQFTRVFMFQHEANTLSGIVNGFYRVGKTSDSAIGYIKKEAILEWSHSLCLGFTDLSGRVPAYIYNDKSIKIAKETKRDEKEYYDMLMPLLDIGVDTVTLEKKYKIAYLARSESNPARLKSDDKQTSDKENKSSLDIMILIESSSGIKDKINLLTQALEGSKHYSKISLSVRVGVSIYYKNEEKEKVEIIQELTTDFDKVIESIAKIDFTNDHTQVSPLFKGIEYVLDHTKWKKAESKPVLKDILVFGMHPNRDTTGTNRLLAMASQQRVRILAVRPITENPASDLKFKDQLEILCSGFLDYDKGIYAELGTENRRSRNIFKNLISIEVERLQEIDAIRTSAIRLDDDVPEDRAYHIKNLSGNDNTVDFAMGWVYENDNDGLKQVEPYVYMTYGDLTKYKFCIQMAITIAQAGSQDKSIIEIAAAILTAISGERYSPDMELNKHIVEMLCLPSIDWGKWNYSLSEIFSWSKFRKEKFIFSVEDQMARLDQMLRDNRLWRKPPGSDIKYTFIKLKDLL